jgi:hypothetical protein
MTQHALFDWQAGKGWLVLSGGGDLFAPETLELESQLLTALTIHGPIAYIVGEALEKAERHLDSIQEGGGQTGYLLDPARESLTSLHEQLSEAGLIILGEGAGLAEILSLKTSLYEAYQQGSTLYVLGRMATLFGTWFPNPQGLPQMGLGWLNQSLIFPQSQAGLCQPWLVHPFPTLYGVSLGGESALSLGPRGEVELWGKKAVKIVLGKDFSTPNR